MEICNAVINDVKEIYGLIDTYAKQQVVLPRSLSSLYYDLQCLYVAKVDRKIVGVGALHILGPTIAEVRSLVVNQDYFGMGIGRKLVERIISEASRLGVGKLISLTYQIEFFEKCGFQIVAKEMLPEKVWKDCVNCPKIKHCDEIAMEIHLARQTEMVL